MLVGRYIEHTCEGCSAKYMSYVSNHRKYCSAQCAQKHQIRGNKTHGGSKTRLHQIWMDMRSRCKGTAGKSLSSYYSDRGISVCAEWGDFAVFRDWSLANGYSEELELDRRDVNGNYEPGNCRWATRSQQMRNTRKRRDGRTSVYKGVSWCKLNKKWKAQIFRSGTTRYIGLYNSEEDAARAYDREAVAIAGEFARPNFPCKHERTGVPS